MQLSPHFTLEELTFSAAALRKGLSNAPDAGQVSNLMRLTNGLLEDVRAILGVPLHIDSGFRSPAVNSLIGGAPTSAHMEGRAADIIPVGAKLENCFNALRTNLKNYDQIIIECNAWIHVAIPKMGVEPRLMAMTAWGAPGNWRYVNVV